jgi:hypothetical protein
MEKEIELLNDWWRGYLRVFKLFISCKRL